VRFRITFWALVAVAIAATATVSTSLAEASSAATGIKVALGGVIGTVSIGLALRILVAVSRPTQSGADDQRDAGW